MNPLTPEQNKNVGSWFLLGGVGNNCLQYINKNIINKAPIHADISFFPAVQVRASIIYTFGGYDNVDKTQIKSCEIYSIEKDKWQRAACQLHVARSQASATLFGHAIIFIFGGYNKELGTLDCIERFDIDKKRITLVDLKMVIPLRRFATVTISKTKILLLGGVTKLNKDSPNVYCFDCE